MAAIGNVRWLNGAMEAGQLNALDRLIEIRRHRQTLWRRIRENWTGWLFSLLLHAVAMGLAVVLIVSVQPAAKAGRIDFFPVPMQQFTPMSLAELFQRQSLEAPDESPSLLPESEGAAGEDPGLDKPYYGLPGTPLGSGGDGPGGPPGGRLRPSIPEINKTGLDVVFVFDSTGSMGAVIHETTTRIRFLTSVVKYCVREARIGLVTYRDKKEFELGEYTYTTRNLPLTSDVKKLERFLNETTALGGGDIPEAIYDGLAVAIQSSGWNGKSTKVIVLFGDAPPRPENDGINKVVDLAANWHKKAGGWISCIDTAGNNRLLEEFRLIAQAGGGEATALKDDKEIVRQLVLNIFGSEYAKQIGRVIRFVEDSQPEPYQEPVIIK